MDKKNQSDVSNRRDFLKMASVSAPAAAAAVAMSGSAAQAVEAVEAGEGLRNTAHVLAYYESAKF